MAHWLFLPDDAIEDLAILASLTPDKIEALRKQFDSNEQLSRYVFYTRVAELLHVSDEAAAELCGFISHVQTQRARLRRDAASVLGELEHFLNRAATKPEHQEKAKRIQDALRKNGSMLVGLFSDLPNRDYSDKVNRLEGGVIPHLHAFRTLCDLRPVFDKDASKIVAYLPVITLGLVTHSTDTDTYNDVSVSLSEADLGEMRESIIRLDKKLALLKKHLPSLTEPKKGEG